MAEVLNFEHNGITVNATESPEAMGGLGDNVIGLVGTAPNAHASIPKNAPVPHQQLHHPGAAGPYRQ